MKKVFYAVLSLLLAVIVTSCGGASSPSGILKAVPDDVDYVVVGSVQTIIESAGGSIDNGRIKLPVAVTDMLGSNDTNDFENFNDELIEMGVNIESAVLMGYYQGLNEPIYVLSINDSKKLTNYLDDNKYREKDSQDGATIYAKVAYEWSDSYYDYVAVNGDYAYLLYDAYADGDVNPVRFLNKVISNAKEKSFADNKVSKYITDGNAAGAALKLSRSLMREANLPTKQVDALEGYYCFKGDLGDDDAEIEMKMFNIDGSEKDIEAFGKFFNPNAKISKKALEYMTDDECFVAAVSLEDVDYDSYLDMLAEMGMSRSEIAQMRPVTEYLSKLNGTIAIGLGLNKGLESFGAILANESTAFTQVSSTIVVQARDGQAQRLVDDMINMMSQNGVTLISAPHGFRLDVPNTDASIYCEVEDDFIVLANHKIYTGNRNPAVSAVDFSDNISCAAIVLDRDSRLARDLNIDSDLQLVLTSDAKDGEMKLEGKIKGAKGNGFLAKLLDVCLNVYDNRKSIENKYEDAYNSNRRSYDYNYYDDYAVADSAVVVEEYEDYYYPY